MDARAKQRLTGAVILVALFVLLVPELLTGPGHSKPVEPADESGMRRYTIDLSAAQPAAQPAATETPPEVKLPEVARNAPAASPGTLPPPLAVPGEAAVPAATPPVEAPAPTVSRPAVSQPPVSRPTTPAAAAPVAAPAAAPVASTPAPVTSAVTAGAFAVQLGTFESRDNAHRLVRDMSARGFAAFVAPFKKDGRELYRVRVGPTRDRAAAEALAAQLKRVGQVGSVVSIS